MIILGIISNKLVTKNYKNDHFKPFYRYTNLWRHKYERFENK